MADLRVPEPARPDEQAEAFGLLFSQYAPAEQEQRVANALGMLRRGELDPAGLLVLRGRHAIEGVLLCVLVPGATGLVWPPRCAAAAGSRAREDALLRHALDWLHSRGARIVQTLLPPQDLAAEALLRNGFTHVTALWYLRHDLDIPVRYLRQPARLRLTSYDPADPDEFHRTLLHTYDGTLDCPEINGVRTIEEIIAGHQAQGRFDPGRWWLAWDGPTPVGVILVADPGDPFTWEIAYVGIVPEARRRGHARELLLHVLIEARAAELREVTLSVDTRNHPARVLYSRLGFEPIDLREVFLSIRQM
jgi:ribosomal protein S18 acetylase RimI-like enzyme